MTSIQRKAPSWGAFKEKKAATESDSEAAATTTTSPAEEFASSPVAGGPAFDLRQDIPSPQENFFAVAPDERSEEELDALGEGAIRQIGRNFVSLVSGGSAFALLAVGVMWILPLGDPGEDTSRTTIASSSEAEVSATVSGGHEFYVDDEAAGTAAIADEPQQFFEITVNLPVPVVSSKDESGVSALKSTLAETSGYPGPIPLPRDVAIAALEDFEEGPLAQGSDDEVTSIRLVSSSGAEVVGPRGIPLPKMRPVF